MKFVADFKKSVLGSYESPLGGLPQDHSFWTFFHCLCKNTVEVAIPIQLSPYLVQR